MLTDNLPFERKWRHVLFTSVQQCQAWLELQLSSKVLAGHVRLWVQSHSHLEGTHHTNKELTEINNC